MFSLERWLVWWLGDVKGNYANMALVNDSNLSSCIQDRPSHIEEHHRFPVGHPALRWCVELRRSAKTPLDRTEVSIWATKYTDMLVTLW